ncbi:MAG TPA: hypothetical protein VFT59_05975 [Candidatus Saccharimonadales bacterium]|nr:hypothetical protein [Candidatus Saccharimonadales bacterium]
MSFFVQATSDSRYRTGRGIASLMLAAVLVVMAVAQLFTFEDFPETIMQMDLLWSGETAAMFQAALIVILEVAALPYLLFMPLSPAGRLVSMAAGWLAVTWWVYVSFWITITQNEMPNGGLLGATVDISSGWWMVGFSLMLALLAVWAARDGGLYARTSKK